MSDDEKIERFIYNSLISSLTFEDSCEIIRAVLLKESKEQLKKLSGEDKQKILDELS